WTIEGSDKGDWRQSGVWQTIDFGSVFRIDRVVFFPIVGGQSPVIYGFERDKQGSWSNFDFLTSNGSSSNSADPVTEGPYHYDLLSEVLNTGRFMFDFNFAPRDMRLFLWRVTKPPQFHRALQLFVFHAEGYPKQVEIESADLSLGGARSIRSVEWVADIPPGTRIEVDTQTGDGFDSVTRYYLINGKEVTKAAYDAAKSRNRGDTVIEQVRDDTWSDWSLPHRFSGQGFESPSPRRWLRARVRLISEDANVMPVLHELRFVANDPVISAGLIGSITPREASVDSLQNFRYSIAPTGTSFGDVGYNRVVLSIPPGVVDVNLVDATIRGEVIDATQEIFADSLVVILPPPVVKLDTVSITFQARLAESPTVFDAFVLNASQPQNTQGVVPEDFGAQRVFLPDAIAGTRLIRNLSDTNVFTPNDDGVNDLYELTFSIVKTDRHATVSVFDLAGRLIAELESVGQQVGRASFQWDGESGGSRVPPGVYVLRIEIDTDARNERVHRTVHVAY
ncbi:MAG: T9SS type B sorting domain-containing protein, partial [Gemmatimonadetes bacterium]|nr:T9SS type B sorting domain-containing protein [Gemmatimonadota bacterium]